MIKDPYLRKIVERSGRREITSFMVKQAEINKYNCFTKPLHLDDNLEQYQNYLKHLYTQATISNWL